MSCSLLLHCGHFKPRSLLLFMHVQHHCSTAARYFIAMGRQLHTLSLSVNHSTKYILSLQLFTLAHQPGDFMTHSSADGTKDKHSPQSHHTSCIQL